MIFKNTST